MEGRPILNGRMNFPICLAPMVGLTHVVMRLAVRRYLPKGAHTIWPTEMLNSRRVPTQDVGDTPETYKGKDEDLLVPQILANEEDPIRGSCKKLEEWGAEAIDINMGCPVKRALKHNYGVALMGDSKYAAEVVSMTKKHSRIPVSVKLRAGIQGDQVYLKSFVQGLEKAGADWICIHPRKAAQKRRGDADWSQISFVRENVAIPVIGNGDVQTAEDALLMLDETGSDAVMIGRALTARPWMLWQLGRHFGFDDPETPLTELPQNPVEEAYAYGEVLKEVMRLSRQYFGETLGLRKFRFYTKVSSPWLNYGHLVFAGVSKAKDFDEIDSFLEEFFQKSGLRMSAKTDLRY